MKLTRASSYALHAVAFMVTQKDTSKPIASHHIAKARGVPERFLLKVLKPLVSARLLMSVKGPNGGYRLAKAGSDISILDVLEAVDGPIRGVVPQLDAPGNGALDRRLEDICSQTADHLRSQLKKIRVTDLAGKG